MADSAFAGVVARMQSGIIGNTFNCGSCGQSRTIRVRIPDAFRIMRRRRTATAPRFPTGRVWPEELPADMAAAFTGEVSVKAFLAKVGTVWPLPVAGLGSRKKWSREALHAVIRIRHGLAASEDEPDDAAGLI